MLHSSTKQRSHRCRRLSSVDSVVTRHTKTQNAISALNQINFNADPRSFLSPFFHLFIPGQFPSPKLASKATVHLPASAVIPSNATLTTIAIPTLITVFESDRIIVDIPSRCDIDQGQSASHLNTLLAGSIIVLYYANVLPVGVFELDRESVVRVPSASIRGGIALILLVLSVQSVCCALHLLHAKT